MTHGRGRASSSSSPFTASASSDGGASVAAHGKNANGRIHVKSYTNAVRYAPWPASALLIVSVMKLTSAPSVRRRYVSRQFVRQAANIAAAIAATTSPCCSSDTMSSDEVGAVMKKE